MLCTVLRPLPSALRPCNPTSLRPAYPPTHPNLAKSICRTWALETAPLNVSYVRQDCSPGSVNLPVILYIRQPWFLRHSVLGEMSAIPGKAGCLLALTLRTWMPLCTHLAYLDASLHSPCVPGCLSALTLRTRRPELRIRPTQC